MLSAFIEEIGKYASDYGVYLNLFGVKVDNGGTVDALKIAFQIAEADVIQENCVHENEDAHKKIQEMGMEAFREDQQRKMNRLIQDIVAEKI